MRAAWGLLRVAGFVPGVAIKDSDSSQIVAKTFEKTGVSRRAS